MKIRSDIIWAIHFLFTIIWNMGHSYTLHVLEIICEVTVCK